MQDSNQFVNDIQCHKVLPHNYASNMNNAIAKITNGKSYSYKMRKVRTLNNFFKFCSLENLTIRNGTDVSLCFSAWQERHFSGAKNHAPDTIISDARALWAALSKLCDPSVKGLPETKSIPRPRRLSTAVFTDTATSQAKVLGGFDLSMDKNGNSLALTLETDVDTFIKDLVTTMRKHRDVIYKISKQYLIDATNRHQFAQRVTKKINKNKFEKSPDLFHPTQTGFETGQKLSLFSNYLEKGECGHSNLIAYINHCHNGLINRNFPGGNNHLYRFTNNQYELREYFGISGLSAVAASNIIIIESGINVESLRKLSLSAQGAMNQFFEPSPNGFRISYHKPRARAHISRNCKHLNANTTYIETAFNYLADATSHHRSMLQGKIASKLFIFDSTSDTGLPSVMSEFPFKYGFKRLLVSARDLLASNPDWCEGVTVEYIDEVLAHAPNAKKLRVTEGIIRWFDSGGNPAAAAKYLGNTEAVAIRNYLPKELQLAVYNQRIRRFQNVLIASATNGEEYQIKALDLKDEGELKEYLSRLDKRVPHWRTVVNALSKQSGQPKDKNVKVTLDICPDNVAVMKACYEKQAEREAQNINIKDSIHDLSQVYQALIVYLKRNPDRRLNRIIQKGEKLYNNKTNSYSQIKIVKQKVNC